MCIQTDIEGSHYLLQYNFTLITELSGKYMVISVL